MNKGLGTRTRDQGPGQRTRQRIGINNRSPRSTYCRTKLLQIPLSLCTICLPPPPATADLPPPASCSPSPRHTWREDLEQFRTTESIAWASVINSYSLGQGIYQPKKNRGISGSESATVFYGIPQRAGVPAHLLIVHSNIQP